MKILVLSWQYQTQLGVCSYNISNAKSRRAQQPFFAQIRLDYAPEQVAVRTTIGFAVQDNVFADEGSVVLNSLSLLAMNGIGHRRAPSSSGHNPRYSAILNAQPTSRALLNGYNGTFENVDQSTTSHNHHHANATLSRSSDLLDPDDPVAMHLLTETAIGDSQQFGILSFEEADELKKEINVLVTRIDATKRKLAIESKIRDASTSLNRLHSSASRDSINDGSTRSSVRRHRRSLMSRGSGSDLLSKSDDELAASTRKCEDLAQELWRLEKRLQEIQKRLLEHTAGVLQMTHKGFVEKDGMANQTNTSNGYHVGNHGAPVLDVGGFDDHSFYSTLDTLLEPEDSRGGNHIAAAFEQQTQSILETERKIWDLNRRLRDSIAQASSGRQALPSPPDPDPADQQGSEAALQNQIGYLEKGLDTLQRSQVDTLQSYKQSNYVTEESLENLNNQLHGIISRSDSDTNSQYPLPPDVSGKNPEQQISFLASGLDTLEQRVQYLMHNAEDSTSKSLAHKERAQQQESTIQALWQDLVAEEEKWRKRDQEANQGAAAPKESFSLDSFASKVQMLHTRSANLHEQKDILSRQIQQQRKLNSQSDSQKDARLTNLTTELERVKAALETTNNEHAANASAWRAQMAASDAAKAQLMDEIQSKRNEISNLEAQMNTIKADQESHTAKLESQETIIAARSAEAEKARNEMESFEGEMVRLQTELTVARAELDGAYGTRAQRAAEVASHPALLQEINDLKERNTKLESASNDSAALNERVQTLQKELSETIGEYEIMTKSSIEYEKEREHLENTIDELRDRCETLETQLSDEKVKWLGVKSPGPPGSRESTGASSTSTSVLKNEFKKMMRETRAENMKALKFEQSERRKLEVQLRTLMKTQTPGKSSLGQSMTV
ncbi:hypothetical protein ACLMJK_005488 [Lecanora helva]